MKFLFYRYGSICEPDMIDALQELGHTVLELTMEISRKDIPPQEIVRTVSETLLQDNFDGVWSVNYYPALSEICNIFHIRYICQTVDSPVMELYSHTLANPWNRVFLFDRQQYDTFHSINPDHIHHLPLAVNTSRLEQLFDTVSPTQRERFTSGVSFVGSLYTEKCPYDALSQADSYLTGYLEGLMEAQSKVYGYFFLPELLTDDIIKRFMASMPDYYLPPERALRDDRMIISLMYLGPKVTSMERTRLLSALGKLSPVDLYTRSDTSSLPVRNRGGVKTLTEMPLVFSGSGINLNMTAKSIRSGIPLRVFDILGCGGFLLSNYQTELLDYFVPGEDLDIYTCEEELLDKTAYYLQHDGQRREMAQTALEKVRREHSYHTRMEQLLALAFSN
ncbi:MAG: glycosyltransferase [Lachnospiraceae bacterium]|nr:glycosyltransferase [Lachnospiraceae bacterium]